MSVVKGTKLYPVRVVEHRPFARWITLFVCLALVALAVYVSHLQGYALGMEQKEGALAEVEHLQTALSAAEKRVVDLEQQIANINLGAEVDRKANEDVRQEVLTLKADIAALEEENTFYRGLMAPTENKRGLTFGAVELSQSDTPRTYSYKVVMQQLATNHQLLKGSLQYKVLGRANGEEREFLLRELSSQVDTDSIRLRFKYFQNIEGELTLPIGFEPIAIELVAKSTGKNPVTVEKRFGWLVEEVL